MYTPIGILIAQAMTSIALAVTGGFFFLSIKNLIWIKRTKFECVKPEHLKKKVYPIFWVKTFSFGFTFLFILHIYCAFL